MTDEQATDEALTTQRRARSRNDRVPAADETLRSLSIFGWLDGVSRSTLSTKDGVTLNVYHAGSPGNHAILLINPIGVSILLLAPLLRYLGKEHFVVSWETRGLPSPAPDAASMRVEDHVDDAVALLRHFRVDSVDVVSYCSGALIALSLLDAGRVNASKAVFISPSILVDGDIRKTNHQRTVIPIWEGVFNKGRDYCTIISNFMAAKQPAHGDVDAELDYVSRLPFIDGQVTYRYAKLLASANKVKCAEVFSRLSLPVLLVHASDDELIHVDLSRYLEGRLCNSVLHVIESGGHYAICKNVALHRAIEEYLAGPAGSRVS